MVPVSVSDPLEYLFRKKELVQMFEDFKQIKLVFFIYHRCSKFQYSKLKKGWCKKNLIILRKKLYYKVFASFKPIQLTN